MTSREEEDTCLLMRIFPAEVWMLILDNLEDPTENLINVCNASPYFGHLLKPKKIQILFPKVWNLLGAFLHDNFEIYRGFYTQSSLDYCLQPTAKTWYSGTLQLRLVCTAWKLAIDNFYQSNWLQRKIMKEESLPQAEWSYDTFQDGSESCYEISTDVDSFLQHFEQSHGGGVSSFNPFLSRSINIIMPRGVFENEEYLEDVTTLFSVYGHHVYNCSFKFHHEPVPCEFSNLLRWLPQLPNLTGLVISMPDETYPDMSLTNIRELGILFTENSFPKLENLKSLITYGVPPPFFNSIVEVNNKLSLLHVKDWKNYVENYDIHSVKFPNLTDLRFSYYSAEGFQKLQNAEFAPTFSKLCLYLKTYEISSREFFSLLRSKWADSLTSCSIRINRIWYFYEAICLLEAESAKLLKRFFPKLSKFKIDGN